VRSFGLLKHKIKNLGTLAKLCCSMPLILSDHDDKKQSVRDHEPTNDDDVVISMSTHFQNTTAATSSSYKNDTSIAVAAAFEAAMQ
jgi:hypothetical protein